MRGPASLRVVWMVALLGAAAGVAFGQEPRPATLGPSALADPEGIQLVYAWRFHAGDDLRWASPAFDDSGWEPVEPGMAPGKLPRGGWTGVGWFRRHLLLEPGPWSSALLMRLREKGVADVYLDGRPVHSASAFVAGATAEVPSSEHGPWPVSFSASRDHLLAVRYSCAAFAAPAGQGEGIGFILSLHEAEAAAQARAAVARQTSELLGALVAILVFVALLHLALYWFYPKMRENLFYALYMAVFAFLVFRDFADRLAPRPAWSDLLNRWGTSAIVVSILLGLLTYFSVRTKPFPRSWKAFVVAAVVLAPAVVFSPEPYSTALWSGYFVVMVVEVIRVEVSGRTVAREGVMILLVGMAVLGAGIVLQLLVNFRVLVGVAGFRTVYVFGIFASVMTMSLFLARTFARTSVHLERRLGEVQALSSQLLEQERAAHASELHRRLLEAENARKSRELEEGRSLQLSMLPASLPEVEGLDIAVAMTTASEVGGDYYDFSAGPGGSLVVAVGDATGHGVAAGIMVTAVKAVLATVGGEPELPAMLAECNRVLRGFHVKALHMCLTVARITPRMIAVCSAGMPPALIWRIGTGAVEELGVGGLPLGSGLSPAYREQQAPLAPGDTVLLATDGFGELLDPAGNVLGFDGVAQALRAVAGVPARQVVERLGATVAGWRGEREQLDDITFVVVRVAR